MNKMKLNAKSKYYGNVIERAGGAALVLAFWLFSMQASA